MSDWLREVEHAYNVQYAGPDLERTPLIGTREGNLKCVRITCVLFLSILFCVGIGIGIYLIIEEVQEDPVTKPYFLISRSGWRANAPLSEIPRFPAVISHVAITQTRTDGCETANDCARIVRDIQRHHVNQRNFSDIAYNFLMTGDGATYEGRGWKRQAEVGFGWGKEMKAVTLVVAFLGNFVDTMPSNIQTEEFKLLLREGVNRGVLDPCYTIALYKDNPQDGVEQMVHVLTRLVMENNRRKTKLKCS